MTELKGEAVVACCQRHPQLGSKSSRLHANNHALVDERRKILRNIRWKQSFVPQNQCSLAPAAATAAVADDGLSQIWGKCTSHD